MFDAQRQTHWTKGDLELILEDGLYVLMDGTHIVDESEGVGMIIEASHAWKGAVKRL